MLLIILAVILIGLVIANFKKIKAIVSSVETKVEQSPAVQAAEKIIDKAAVIAPKKATAQTKPATPKTKAKAKKAK